MSSMRLASHGPLELGQRVVPRPELGEVRVPGFAHVVVHAERCSLVNADIHRLAGKTPSDEVPHQVLGDGAQPLGPGQQRVLPPEPPGELATDQAGRSAVDLRHHYASTLAANGVDVFKIAQALGHTTPRLVIATYGHLVPDGGTQVRRVMDAAWSVVTDVSPGPSRLTAF